MRLVVKEEVAARTRISLGTPNAGLWLDMPPEDIPLGGWSSGFDFIVTTDNRTRPRKGRASVSDIGVDKQVLALTELRTPHATNRVFAFMEDDDFYYYNGASWTDDTTAVNTMLDAYVGSATLADSTWQFIQMGDGVDEYMICCSEDNYAFAIKMTASTGVYSYIEIDTTAFYSAGNELTPKWCAEYMGRSWFGGDPTYPTSIFCSDSGDPVTFSVSSPDPLPKDCQELLVGDRDGDHVVGIVAKFGLLFIIKERSIWYLNAQAADPANWEMRRFASGIGGVLGCGYTIQDLGPDALFMSNNGNLLTLKDTERYGQFNTNSLSAGQLQTYLSELEYTKAASVIDSSRGWYILSAAHTGKEKNGATVVYDFGKAEQLAEGRRPGNWYRFAQVLQSNVSVNARPCYAKCTLFTNGVNTVMSGGHLGHVFKEFSQTKEELDDGTEYKIRAWYIGKYISDEQLTEFRLTHMQAAMVFYGQPTDAYVALGAVVDPVEFNLVSLLRVDAISDYDTPFFWNITNWNEGYWNVSSDSMSEAPVNIRGRTFAAYVVMYGSDAELSKMYATLEPGRT